MNADDFAKWFAAHRRRFTSLSEDAAPDFRRALVDLAATAEEAEAASYKMAVDGCRFVADNMPTLRRAILAIRAERQPKQSGPAECHVCHGAGMVSVPHPARIKDGIWDGKTTCAVGCNCGNPRPPGIRTLSNYEMDYPHWPLLENRAKDAQVVTCGLDPELMRAELNFLMKQVGSGELTLKQAQARYSEPFIEARRQREKEAADSARTAEAEARIEVRRLEIELAEKSAARMLASQPEPIAVETP